MQSDAHSVLQHVFGYHQFRGEQQTIIDNLIQGDDALVLMPTGGGKSLCYQIPALVRPGTGVVISPLIALMQDQVDALKALGVNAGFLNSTLNMEQQRALEDALLKGELDMLYIAPERLIQPRTLSLLHQAQIALFAIDEAHCVSQWGHDFRNDYLQLSLLHREFPNVPRIALTATADQRTRTEIAERLDLTRARHFVSSFDRPNIQYRIERKDGARNQLLRLIRAEHDGDAGIVYCLSRNKVERVAEWLCQQGVKALPYHAGLPAQTRETHQQRFLREDGLVMVATIAFGMGIDKPDVRFVAHLDLPKSIESYYQETGRAGRDGLPADAWMAYGLQDVITLRQMQQDSGAADQQKRIEQQKLDAMLGLCEIISCRRQALLHYFGDSLDEPCGNCDNCLTPPDTWEATVAAQKALSCVYRTEQRFGVTYLVDVLLGKRNERISRFGHDSLSTFGIGQELTASEWKALFRQLIASGYLSVDMEGHGAIKLTANARPILRGEQRLTLRKPSKPARRGAKGASAAKGHGVLWEALRQHRKALADAQGVPAYVIFNDATLAELVAQKPQTLQALGTISGIGARKLADYGEGFLEVVLAHPNEPETPTDIGNSAMESAALLRQGLTPEQVAEQRGLAANTVYRHLSDAIQGGELALEEVVTIDPATLAQIHAAFEQFPGQGLKVVFEALEGRIDYPVLHCVRASMTAKR